MSRGKKNKKGKKKEKEKRLIKKEQIVGERERKSLLGGKLEKVKGYYIIYENVNLK